MAEQTVSPSSRIDPGTAWTIVTDSPLKGLGLAREALRVLAWDDVGQVYLLDARGEFLGVSRAPGPILHGGISDDGSLIALVGEQNRLWLLGPDLETIEDRASITDPTALAVDPHGRYLAVASKLNIVQFYSRHGKQAGRLETRQHLSHLAFVPASPTLIGVGAYGSISGFELGQAGPGRLAGEMAWTEQLMSGVGRLATTGDGGMILIGCYTHGVQRFDLRGRNEGAYHLGGSAAMAVPDFGGRSIAVATQEGELAILSGTGNVRWRTGLPRPAVALEVDALGRFLIYGLASGEVVRLDFQGGGRTSSGAPAEAASRVSARPGSGLVRPPDWQVEVVANDDLAEFAVLGVVDRPARIGLITQQNRLELFNTAGKRLGQAPPIAGVGRIVRSSDGWIAAATDRQIVACDLTKNTAHKVDLSLAELTHLEIEPGGFGLAIVQERDRIGRATIAGRWIWKAELNKPVESIAIGPEGHSAFTTEDGRLLVYNPAGVVAGTYRSLPAEPLLLARAPAGSPPGVAWVSLARRNQVIRGHHLDGRVAWESPTPWDGWSFHEVGGYLVVTAADGRAVAYDGSGRARDRGGKSDGPLDLFYPGEGESGRPLRVAKQGVHLICSDFDGRVDWRAVASGSIGPMAAGRPGVAAMIGRSLAWFGHRPTGP